VVGGVGGGAGLRALVLINAWVIHGYV